MAILNRNSIFFILFFLIFCFACLPSKKVNSESNKEKANLEFNYCFSEGTKERLLRNYPKAIVFYKNCIRLNQKSSTSFYQLSLCYDETKKTDSAIFFAKYACFLNSSSFWIMYNYARLLYKYNQMDESNKIYKELINKFPHINFIYEEAALVFIKTKDYNEALKIYSTLEKRYGVNEKYTFAKEKIYLTLNEKSKALLELLNLSEKFENNVKYMVRVAEFYLQDDNFSEAKKYYDKAAMLAPENGLVHLSYANYFRKIKFDREMFDQLMLFLKDSLIESRNKLDALIAFSDERLGIIIKGNDFEKLMDFLLASFKDDPVLIDFAGDYYYRKGNYNKASFFYSKVVQRKTNNLNTWKNYLNSCLIKEDFQMGKNVADEALKYFPEQPFFYLYGAISNFNLQDFDNSLRLLEQGKSFVIDDAALEALFWYNMAETYQKKGNHLESDRCFEKSISLDSTNLYVINNYCFYQALRSFNLKNAKMLAIRYGLNNSKNPVYLDTFSYVLYKNEEFSEAKKILEYSFTLGGSKIASNNEHYGDLLFKLNDFENAKLYWIKAQELGNKSKDLKSKIEQLK